MLTTHDQSYEELSKRFNLHRKKLIWIPLPEWEGMQSRLSSLTDIGQTLALNNIQGDQSQRDAAANITQFVYEIEEVLLNAVLRVEDSAEG